MRTTLTVLVIIIFAVLTSWLVISNRRTQALGQQYAYLDQPRISDLPAQRVLLLEIKGDPSRTSGLAISSLYKAYFSLRGKGLWLKMPAPRARWPLSPDRPRAEMIGLFALPLPDDVEALPAKLPKSPLPVRFETWEYGTVVEVLHRGGYKDEAPTVAKLTDFAASQGYIPIGPHEEEYVKGPGMFGPGNPKTYLTILRYRVERKPTR